MSVATQEIIAEILSNGIDKQAAIQSFELLPEAQREQLLAQLKESVTAEQARSDGKLQAIDQRELTDEHRGFIASLSAEYEAFVPQSRLNISKHQHYFVDQRRPVTDDLGGLGAAAGKPGHARRTAGHQRHDLHAQTIQRGTVLTVGSDP